MQTIHLVRRLTPFDLRSVGRDPLLRWLALMPLAFALAARGLLPALLGQAARLLPFDPLAYYGPMAGFALLLLAPTMAGMIAGFLLLDLRDDGVLAALRVAPPTLGGYLAYRLALPMLVSVALTAVAFPLSGLPMGSPAALLIAALATAPVGPLYALFLGAFAANKVQGFALMKAAGICFALPIAAYFAPAIWQPLLALNPLYWPARLYWALLEGAPAAWLYLGGALAYPALLIALLLRRLGRGGAG